MKLSGDCVPDVVRLRLASSAALVDDVTVVQSTSIKKSKLPADILKKKKNVKTQMATRDLHASEMSRTMTS